MRKRRTMTTPISGKTAKTLIAALLFCVFLALSLSGCGKARVESGAQTSSETQAPTEPAQEADAETPADTEQPTPQSTPIVTQEPVFATLEPTNAAYDLTDMEEAGFEIWFLDVGQGDAACILCDGEAMLIDGGDRGKSQFMYSFLQSHGIDRLKAIVATHSDADHIGGLSGALEFAPADTVYCTQTEGSTKAFENLTKQLQKREASITVPQPGVRFLLGSASVTILYPDVGALLSDNTSLVVRICYGDASFLFMGDCETNDEAVLLANGTDLHSDVLKVAHHGSGNSTGERFLESVDPAYAVISVGKDNGYGHPAEQVLLALKERGIVLYRTDLNGTVHLRSDGMRIAFDVEKNKGADSYGIFGPISRILPTEEPSPTQGAEQEAVVTYVANKNTMKFHYPHCSSVPTIHENNRWNFTGTRDELIEMGYVPCKKCNP